jgi:electron-transferring-flavoprotein dehydrogenase
MQTSRQTETMEFDIVIVGAGPAGLAAACRLGQLNQTTDRPLSVCVLEKGADIGAHIISGAILEPRALNELFSDWQQQHCPVTTAVKEDRWYWLANQQKSQRIPNLFVAQPLHNKGNYIISLGNLCRWLGQQAQQLGIEVFAGFSASEVLYDDHQQVIGVSTGAMGVDREGKPKANYQPGVHLLGKYTLFAEGCRGHLAKQLMNQYQLDRHAGPQHYGIGFKELWQIPKENHQAGLVIHSVGWPLDKTTQGGGFLYHLGDDQIAVGYIIDLNYSNPHLNPFAEFQRYKHHPLIRPHLLKGKRIGYGARAVNKGGLQALPELIFPGGALLGCDAGFLNFAKIKGSHTAMKTGMLAAEATFNAIQSGSASKLLSHYPESVKQSWVQAELYRGRNVGPAIHKWGPIWGGAFAFIEQNIFAGKLPVTLQDKVADHQCLKLAGKVKPVSYPKADNQISFDRLSSVYLSNTQHEENQPCHLQLKDPQQPVEYNLPRYDEPAQRYCPAAVYEIVNNPQGQTQLQINATNCIHCKTCDIKDPGQNIHWVAPEGGGGPSYQGM